MTKANKYSIKELKADQKSIFSMYLLEYFHSVSSGPKPLWLYEISSLFKAHLSKLMQSGEVKQFN